MISKNKENLCEIKWELQKHGFVSCVYLNDEPVLIGQETTLGTIYDNRTSDFLVSPNGMRVAYLIGSGEFEEETGSWETSSLVVDAKKWENESSRIFRDQRDFNFIQFSPDSKHVGSIEENNFVLDDEVIPYFSSDSEEKLSAWCKSQHKNACTKYNYYNRKVSSFALSSNTDRFAYVSTTDNSDEPNWIVENDKIHKYYGKVESPLFSPDGRHLAYIAKNQYAEEDCFVVLDEKEGNHYSSVSKLMFSRDSRHFKYEAIKNGESIVVVDGKEEKKEGNTIEFDPITFRKYYLVKIDGKIVLALDKINNFVSGQYDSIYSVIFSPDGLHHAFVAKKENLIFIVHDGQEGKKYPQDKMLKYGDISLVYSQDSKNLAYQLCIGPEIIGHKCLIVINEIVISDDSVFGFFRFSSDGKHHAYYTKDSIVFDSKRYLPSPNPNFILSLDGKSLAVSTCTSNCSIIINKHKGKSYPYILSNSIGRVSLDTKGSSIQFDPQGNLHFIAINDGNLISVEIKFESFSKR